ncbi:coiled-coil-helix-coiled-coil-helix domain-containing protein [Aspergillus novofumigatus IBT 16806]|uniref:CHCH domain protein n=1 Tax=Aspergillus novofumigatus (strain IBT 16806) TaxID=1392255 RepID=A0A2I1C238_ASPN1|nr:uncharacterized protein P174DRAFT_514096 [Aspergillus novofumigatus IBT 16806]PKX91653.1 hypothetical protein P174DRAFT_514096 [Aspergillus novofumigatus IBT 16806]
MARDVPIFAVVSLHKPGAQPISNRKSGSWIGVCSLSPPTHIRGSSFPAPPSTTYKNQQLFHLPTAESNFIKLHLIFPLFQHKYTHQNASSTPCAPSRPTVAPARPAAAPAAQHHQPHSTAAHPPAQAQQAPPPMAPVQQSSGPGLFGQMASTAAGVAVGSSIGHAIGGLFSGGSSSSAPAEAQQAPPPAQAQPMDNGLWQSSATNSSWETPACETDVRNFRKCLDENQGNMTICGWYLDQLKACQAAAKQY